MDRCIYSRYRPKIQDCSRTRATFMCLSPLKWMRVKVRAIYLCNCRLHMWQQLIFLLLTISFQSWSWLNKKRRCVVTTNLNAFSRLSKHRNIPWTLVWRRQNWRRDNRSRFLFRTGRRNWQKEQWWCYPIPQLCTFPCSCILGKSTGLRRKKKNRKQKTDQLAIKSLTTILFGLDFHVAQTTKLFIFFSI